MGNEYLAAEARLMLSRLFQIGKIKEVDYSTARAKVEFGDITTTWLPWLTRAGSNSADWNPPSVDEQVFIICPHGDTNLGVIVGSIYRLMFPAPSDSGQIWEKNFQNGDFVKYDKASGAFTIKATTINLDGDVVGTGQITDYKSSLDDIRDTYNTHTHTGDSGGSTSAPTGLMT